MGKDFHYLVALAQWCFRWPVRPRFSYARTSGYNSVGFRAAYVLKFGRCVLIGYDSSPLKNFGYQEMIFITKTKLK
jgi:hypothetical protein